MDDEVREQTESLTALLAALEGDPEREAFIAGFNAHRHLPDDTTVAEAYERWREER